MTTKVANVPRALIAALILFVSASFILGDPVSAATNTHSRRQSSCYLLKEVVRGPKMSQMPAVCKVMLRNLNATCDTAVRDFQLFLPRPFGGLSLPNWESLPLSKENMQLVESLVKTRTNYLINALAPIKDHGDWKTRGDQDWEIAKRAIERAQQLRYPIAFDRARLKIFDTKPPIEVYRMQISAPWATPEEQVRLQSTLEFYVRSYALTPTLYTLDNGNLNEPLAGPRSRYPLRSVFLADTSQAIVLNKGQPYMVGIDPDKSLDLLEINASPTGGMSPAGIATWTVCTLQRQPTLLKHRGIR